LSFVFGMKNVRIWNVGSSILLPDEAAAADGYLRVIDESGEDYLYPQEYFLQIELPKAAEKALLSAA
jgi:hypothetical protein